MHKDATPTGRLSSNSPRSDDDSLWSPLRIATTRVVDDGCVITRLEKATMLATIHKEPEFFRAVYVVSADPNGRIEEDLIDQLFNSSEKRLARLLLLLANFGKGGTPEPIVGKFSQEMLAEMIGTTRSRISYFMNKFRKLGFIEYNGKLKVHKSLLNMVLHVNFSQCERLGRYFDARHPPGEQFCSDRRHP
jgi:CRP/FNR family transcriptional regulator, cyclic AMP receptor protein